MRVVVLGASSFSTPRLARYLAMRRDTRPLTLVLAGRTPERVAAVARAARLLSAGSAVTIEAANAAAECRRQCLAGADIVLLQPRVGGYEARQYDETFPLEFDLCGDEGLGAGGLAAAWRTWPVLADILHGARAACRTARIVLLTSPLSLLVRMARCAFPDLNVAGICELPFTTLCGIARAEGRSWSELEWQYLGINHIGWIYGGSRRPIGLKYLRLERAQALAEQKAKPGARAVELASLARQTWDVYASGRREEIERALAWREADWYDAAVGPLIAAAAGGSAGVVFFLSVRQDRWAPAFEPGDVLEIPHVSRNGGFAPRPNRLPPPPELVERLHGFVRYERAAAQAVMARDRSGIERALSLHPWIPPSVPLDLLASRVTR